MLSTCRLALLAISISSFVAYVILHVDSTSSTTSEDAVRSRAAWLRLHPPRQASHDAELLRRRMLASLVELEPAALGEHVPAIAASLDHDDSHIRALAVNMLARLAPPAIATHDAAIAARLAHNDESVRLAVVKALARAPPAVLASHANALLARLSDDEPAVRWAAVDALSHLDANALAPITLIAVDALVGQQDVSIARAAVASWMPKLGAHEEVMRALSRLIPGAEEERQQGGRTA